MLKVILCVVIIDEPHFKAQRELLEAVVGTFLALNTLKTIFAARQAEWELVANKGQRFLYQVRFYDELVL